jgi:lambda family phage portal protein
MLHLFEPTRFGQTRGYPSKLASVMTPLKWLQDFRLSELVASKSAASKMAFIRTPTGENDIAEGYLDEDGYMPTLNFEPGTIDVLPHGTDIEFANWNHPNTGVGDFDRAMMRTIASGLGVSYSSLSNDLSNTSYSSARVGLLDERDAFKTMQTFIIDHFCKPIYRRWLLQELTTGKINLPANKYDKFARPVEFNARGYHSVDPLKEAQANQLGLANGLLTIQDCLNQNGKQLSQHFSELDSQAALADKFGIELAYEPYGTKINQQTGEPFDDDNENEVNQNE